MIQDITVPVLRNIEIGGGSWLLEFPSTPSIAAMRPAQFFMIGVPGSDVLLRRPFSVCGLPGTFDDAAKGAVQILYRIYGRGTQLLASLRPGAEIRVLGPLGKGFTLPARKDARIVLVAGGIGSAPYPAFLAEIASAGRSASMIYGAKTAAELTLLHWFRTRCDDVTVTTDDGSEGTRGFVTTAVASLFDRGDRDRLHLYVCGPSPMLKAVARLAVDAGVTCDLSLEAPMACGFGVCLGCVVPAHGAGDSIEFKRVCVEGPVMPAADLAW